MTRTSYPQTRGARQWLKMLGYGALGIASAGMLFAISGHGAFEYTDRAERRDTAYAKHVSSIKGFIAPTISIEGTPYTLVEGAVLDTTGRRAATSTALSYLRTAEYVIRTRLDPIMALPESNPARLETVARALAEYTDTLTPYFSTEEMRHIRRTLHPAEFVRTLPGLERARRALLSDPSPAAIATYDTALTGALTAYRTYLYNLEITLRKIETTERERAARESIPTEAYTAYTFPGGSSTLAHLSEAAVKLAQHAAHLAQKHEMRIACFRGEMDACPPLSGALRALTQHPLKVSAPTEHAPAVLPAREAEVRELLVDMLDPRPELATDPEQIRTVHLSEDACSGSSAPAYFIAWNESVVSNLSAWRYAPLRDIFFYDTTDILERSDSTFFKNAVTYGLPYLHQLLGNTYMCPDSGAVAARIASVLYLYDTLQDDPPLLGIDAENMPSGVVREQITEILRQEHILANTHIASETAVAHYLDAVGQLLYSIGEQSLASYIGRDRVHKLEHLLLMARAQSSRAHELAAAVLHMNRGIPHLMDEGIGMGIDYLYAARSSFMRLLLGFNATVVEPPISLFMSRGGDSFEKYGMVTYHNDLSKTHTRAEILELMRTADAFYAQ